MERRRVGEVHTQESDNRRDAGNGHRQRVHADAFLQRRDLVGAVAHQSQLRDQDVNAVGNGEREHDRRRGYGDGCELDAHIAGEAHGGDGGQTDHQKRSDSAGEATQQDHHEDQKHAVHDRNQCHGIGLAAFGESVVEHGNAGQRDRQVREIFLDLGPDCTDVGDGFGDLGQALFRILQNDVHARGCGVPRDQVAAQQGFGEGDRGAPIEFRLGHVLAAPDKVLDRQVIALGPGVLKVGDGIDPDGEGRLPCRRRHAFDGGGL